ncbi:MAG: MFS transporter [Clostridiales bacterium]|nr:MFS transporter [Clostridiales bacterium]
MKVKVEIQLPKEVKAKGLRILHVHNDGTIDEINDVAVANGVAVVEVASFSQFVLVTPAAHGFCIGWIVFIFAMVEMLCACVYAILKFGLIKDIVAKLKLDALYSKLNLLSLIGMCVAGAIFLFALIALCVHQCAISIISFILASLVCCFFTYFFLEDRDLLKKMKSEAKTVDKDVDSKDIKDIEE